MRRYLPINLFIAPFKLVSGEVSQWVVIHLMFASLVFALPPHSAVASFGRALTLLIAQWPTLFPEAPIFLIHGGPLGYSCAKGEDTS
jgi:hypothetical protein